MVANRAISRACAATPDKARPGLEPSLQWHHIGGGYPPVSSGAAAPAQRVVTDPAKWPGPLLHLPIGQLEPSNEFPFDPAPD